MERQTTTGCDVWVHGLSGRMGQELKNLLTDDTSRGPLQFAGGSGVESSEADLLAGVRRADCIIDFSNHAGNRVLLEGVTETGVREKVILIGSTGLQESDKIRWNEVAASQNLTLMIAPNTSLGISLALQAALSIVGVCSREGFDVEIEETHHRNKIDAPGGTALYLADNIADSAGLRRVDQRTGAREAGEIGVNVTRGGGVFGEHKIRLLGDFEEVTISHRAFSRTLFAKGALYLLNWLCQRPRGVYTLKDVYQ